MCEFGKVSNQIELSSNLFLYRPKSQITICLRGLHKLYRHVILCPLTLSPGEEKLDI